MDSIIRLEDVSFQYQDRQIALDKVNLTVKQGEFLGVVGPNGGGKTTLLKLILGLLIPNSGKLTVLDKTPKQASRDIGYVAQFSTFKRDFPIKVKDVVLMGRLGCSGGAKSPLDKILQQLAIEHLANKTIDALSGGELQRVMIARALISAPKLLLLDEPTASIDMHAEQNIFDLLKEINKEVTILLVSHDIGFISRYIKRVVCLNKTLICHPTTSLTPELMEQLYEIPVRMIQHNQDRTI
ncbi:MAG: metal ABC transporter ATP-binding protein [Gammaproteobacteria bacterium]|nr:metal ABC transporter ATP-binding protein [Gammaproteobacteria bacterium]